MNGKGDSIGKFELSRQVLFLDFDGVLHRLAAVRTRRGIASTSPSIRLFEFAPILVECLAPYGEVKIVLSTSWVHHLGYQRAKNALPPVLSERVVGATYHSKYFDAEMWPSRARGTQILRYVLTHRLTSWLAIDDEIVGFGDYLSHVVICDENVGLGDLRTQDSLRTGLSEQFG
ncbi:HAD domain-containing protein [Paraburkholderia guartelaensis]|uniref:HAD domain-containing protein n=1 Tax=Paraburkholderia guartelaensis TaxID=2546446 RepID=UPI002AB6068C|nr:HAD domain-containing protein [Paraburkholderia guartelaensis]